jgi:hypothetical protein
VRSIVVLAPQRAQSAAPQPQQQVGESSMFVFVVCDSVDLSLVSRCMVVFTTGQAATTARHDQQGCLATAGGSSSLPELDIARSIVSCVACVIKHCSVLRKQKQATMTQQQAQAQQQQQQPPVAVVNAGWQLSLSLSLSLCRERNRLCR